MQKKIISLDERIRKAQKLIHSAEVNFSVCRTIQEAKGTTHPFSRSDFLLLASNNSFDASVSILHTLLSSTDEKEIRLKPILQDLVARYTPVSLVSEEKIVQYRQILEEAYPDLYPVDCRSFMDPEDERYSGEFLKEICRSSLVTTGLQDLENLRSQFEDSHFHRIRHELVAHKNSRQPHLGDTAGVFIKESALTSLGEIIKTLRINACFWLGYSPPNPDLKGVLKGVRRALDVESEILSRP